MSLSATNKQRNKRNRIQQPFKFPFECCHNDRYGICENAINDQQVKAGKTKIIKITRENVAIARAKEKQKHYIESHSQRCHTGSRFSFVSLFQFLIFIVCIAQSVAYFFGAVFALPGNGLSEEKNQTIGSYQSKVVPENFFGAEIKSNSIVCNKKKLNEEVTESKRNIEKSFFLFSRKIL